jgi:hypothetical protein
MPTRTWRAALGLLMLLVTTPAVNAQSVFPVPAPAEPARATGLADLLKGWAQFADVWLMLDVSIAFLLAVLLGAALAYHPLVRGKAASIEELEQPKTFIMYALIGALTGIVVPAHPMMGFVIFGIGGLMRFRTEIGSPKDTGRVILAVVVGVACGLKLIPVAVLATAFGWILIWLLERQDLARMQVKGLSRETIPRAVEAYRAILTGAGCRLLRERKKMVKGTLTFVFIAPRLLDREAIEQRCAETIAADIRGAIDWDMS